MTEAVIRKNGRGLEQLRPLHVTYNWSSHAAGSVMLELGSTKILASVMIQQGVPAFMRGKGSGWLTAEYGLLPAATKPRSVRESVSMKRPGRSVEISRLIGRVLRSVMRLEVLGERTVHIDCDVMNADGSTRVASILAASLALRDAERRWLMDGAISSSCCMDQLVACSVGLRQGAALLDLDYEEDAASEMDCTVVMTRSGKLVEIHCGTEGGPVAWSYLDSVVKLSRIGASTIIDWYAASIDARYAVQAQPREQLERNRSVA